MTILERCLELKEYTAAGAFEEPERSLFYRKALALRRYYENCKLPQYNGEFLYPSGNLIFDGSFTPNFIWGISVNDTENLRKNPDIAKAFNEDFYRYSSSYVPIEHTVAGNMFTHSMPNYERILKEGFNSYIPRIEKIKDTDMRDGLLHLIEGIRSYSERCVEYLVSVNADRKLISALKKVPFCSAENIYEAIIGWNFIMYLDGCDNLGSLASGLVPYFNGEDVTDYLRNLYDNLDINNGYSMSLYTDYSPLTLQCLEASKGKRRPMIELFVDENTPDEIWNKAFEVVHTSNGQPAFYNPHTLLNGLQKKFSNITDEDIKKFCGGGCTESMIAGFSNVGSLDAGINLLLILEKVMYEHLEKSSSFEEFYTAYIDEVGKVVDSVTEGIYKSQKDRAEFNPLPMRSLLIDDCIDNGLDYNNGGARYRWSIINFAGIINVIDSMMVIKDTVFKQKTISATDMLEKLKTNDIRYLNQCRNHKNCFGTDNETVNAFANKISSKIYSMLDDKKPYNADAFIAASIQFLSQVDAGKGIGATPDGREAHAPLCDSLSAIFGKDVKGPTALLNSVTSLDFEKLIGVGVLNFNINPDYNNEILKALILSYFKNGGNQMQITCTSREVLEEAYKNPELHKNLIVRVGGYSDYFCQLTDELKKLVINRTIQY